MLSPKVRGEIDAMIDIKELSAIAHLLMPFALLGWLSGDRSFRGRTLVLRQGGFWVASRWLGLGLFLGPIVAATKNDLRLETVGMVGSMLLLVGTARKVSKERFTIGNRRPGSGVRVPSEGEVRGNLSS